MAIEALMPNLSSASASRQKPTRLPYSCQVQFGMSGVGTPPAGGVFTVRGIGELMSHSSMETSTQTAMRLPSGNASFGRRVIGEYGIRSIGNMAAGPLNNGEPGAAAPGQGCGLDVAPAGLPAACNECLFVTRSQRVMQALLRTGRYDGVTLKFNRKVG